jgi:hypothetical protein
MLIGSSTAHKLQGFCGAAGADIEVTRAVIAIDAANPPVVQGAEFETDPLPNITTTAVTDIVVGAASRTKRVLSACARNNSSSVATQWTWRHVDGTDTVDIESVTLLPGETSGYDGQRYYHRTAQGGEYTYDGPPAANLGPSGAIAETMPRDTCPEVNTTAAATGTLFLQAIYLRAGQLVSSISIWAATTAAATPTNKFFALYDSNRNLLAQSANDTTAAWAANTVKTLAMTTPYRVPVTGLYYIGLLQVATTIATIKGGTAKTSGTLAAAVPVLHGTSSTGLTTTLPNPAAAITGGTASIYAAVN